MTSALDRRAFLPNRRATPALFVAAALLLASCGAPAATSPAISSPDGSPPPAATGEVPPASPGAPTACMSGDDVTLTLWIFEGEEEVLPQFKEGFEASHPACTLEITHVPEDLYVTKLDTAFAAGSPPDIAYMYERRWMKAGAFLPLDEYLASRDIDLSRFSQGPFGACTLDEQLYCIGSYLGQVILMYDRQLFDAANLPYPSATEPLSVDEYAEIAGKLARPSEDLSQQVWGGEVAATYWWMEPGTLFSQDGRTTIGYVDDEATIHSWDVLTTMARDRIGLTGADQEAAGLESTDLLATHQLGMAIADNSALGELQEQGVDVGVAPTPVEVKGDSVHVGTWMDSWGVTTASAHPDEAKALIAWIATEGNKVRAEGGTLPLDFELAEETGWAAGAPGRQELTDLAAAARPGFFVPSLFGELSATLEDTFERIIESGDAAGALREAAPIMQDDLDQGWQTWESIE